LSEFGEDWQVHLRPHAIALLNFVLWQQKRTKAQLGFFTPWSANDASEVVKHLLLNATGCSWHTTARSEILECADQSYRYIDQICAMIREGFPLYTAPVSEGWDSSRGQWCAIDQGRVVHGMTLLAFAK